MPKRIKRNKVSHITPLLYGYAKVCFVYIQVIGHSKRHPTQNETIENK